MRLFCGIGDKSMVSIDEIQKLADHIAQEFQPEKVILFGSYAEGRPTEDSDVDLFIVIPYQGKSWEAAAAVRGRVRPKFPVDLVVRSPQELRKRLEMGDIFFQHILTNGKLLYESHNK